MGRRKGLGPERSVLAVGHTLVHTSTSARTGARTGASTGVPPSQLPGFTRSSSLPKNFPARCPCPGWPVVTISGGNGEGMRNVRTYVMRMGAARVRATHVCSASSRPPASPHPLSLPQLGKTRRSRSGKGAAWPLPKPPQAGNPRQAQRAGSTSACSQPETVERGQLSLETLEEHFSS